MEKHDFSYVVRDWKDRFPVPQSLDSQEFFEWMRGLDEDSRQAIQEEIVGFYLQEMGVSQEVILGIRTDDRTSELFRGFKMSPQAAEQLKELAERLLSDDTTI